MLLQDMTHLAAITAEVAVSVPSMRTLRASLSTLSVERRTRIQKMNVQMGSTIVHVGW